MRHSIFKILIILCSAAGSTALAMQVPNFKIIVENKVTSGASQIPLKVAIHRARNTMSLGGLTLSTFGPQFTTIFFKNEFKPIGFISELTPGSELEFSGYGKGKEYLIRSTKVGVDALITEWKKIKTSNDDPLVITVEATGMIWPFSLSFSYSPSLPRERKPVSDNPYEEFGGIKKYDLDKILYKTKIIENRPLWFTEVVPAGAVGTYQLVTRAEDVYRYILGLAENYTLDDLTHQYTILKNQWDPTTMPNADQKTRHYATQVFNLITIAYEGLKTALKDKETESIEKAQQAKQARAQV